MSTIDEDLAKDIWPKCCGCGTEYSEDDWESLRYVGIQKIPVDYGMSDLELRNCRSCGSTMAISVPTDFLDI